MKIACNGVYVWNICPQKTDKPFTFFIAQLTYTVHTVNVPGKVTFFSPNPALSSILFMAGFGTQQSFLFAKQKKRCVYVTFLGFFASMDGGADLLGAARGG